MMTKIKILIGIYKPALHSEKFYNMQKKFENKVTVDIHESLFHTLFHNGQLEHVLNNNFSGIKISTLILIFNLSF